MRAILRTGGRSIEYYLGKSKEDPEQMELDEDDAKIVKDYMDAFDGIEVMLSENGFLIGYANDSDNVEKIKKALYLTEQCPIFGKYIDDPDGFEHDWNEEEYVMDAGIAFNKDEYEILNESPRERYNRLLRTHPQIRVINECGEIKEGVFDAEIESCAIRDYVSYLFKDGHYVFKDEARALVDGMCLDIVGSFKEKEIARKNKWEKVKQLRWQRALFVKFKTGAKNV